MATVPFLKDVHIGLGDTGLSRRLREAKKAMALYSLENKLSKIINTANGHRKNKLPKHAPAYQELFRQATIAVHEFCTTHSVPEQDVYTQIPALGELREWGSAPPSAGERIASGVTKAGAVSIGVIITIILTGLVSGWIQRLFHFGWALAHHAR